MPTPTFSQPPARSTLRRKPCFKAMWTVATTFHNRVAQGRKISKQQVNKIAQGRVWTGEDALKIKLVDKLGNLDDAVAVAAKRAGLKEYHEVHYPVAKVWGKRFWIRKCRITPTHNCAAISGNFTLLSRF